MQVLTHPVPRGYKKGKQDLWLHEADGKKHHRELEMVSDYGGGVVLTERGCVCPGPKSPASPDASLLLPVTSTAVLPLQRNWLHTLPSPKRQTGLVNARRGLYRTLRRDQ